MARLATFFGRYAPPFFRRSNPSRGRTSWRWQTRYVGGLETTAEQFIERLTGLRSPDADQPDDFSGVGMGQIFRLTRGCMDMSPAEIERLLESPITPLAMAP